RPGRADGDGDRRAVGVADAAGRGEPDEPGASVPTHHAQAGGEAGAVRGDGPLDGEGRRQGGVEAGDGDGRRPGWAGRADERAAGDERAPHRGGDREAAVRPGGQARQAGGRGRDVGEGEGGPDPRRRVRRRGAARGGGSPGGGGGEGEAGRQGRRG